MSRKPKACIRWADVSLTVADLLREAKLGDGLPMVREVAIRSAFAQKAIEAGLELTDDETQEAVEAFYTDRDVFSDDDRKAWRDRQYLTEDEVQRFVIEDSLSARWRDHIASEGAIQHQIDDNALDYARALIEAAHCETMGAARETLLALREGEIPWRHHDWRVTTREDAPEDIASALFAGKPGDWFGPIETEEGCIEIWRLVAIAPAVLDARLRARIQDKLIGIEADALLPDHRVEFTV